jgi:hypothetical protein
MDSIIHIKTNPKLSPKHIEFNKWVQSIEKLRVELQREEKKLELFSEYYIKNILPVREAVCQTKLKMATTLDDMSEASKLPSATLNDLSLIIPELLSEAFELIIPDEDAKLIFEKWTFTNYDDIVNEVKEEQMEELSDYMRSMGIDFDTSDLDFDDPETIGKIHERMHQAKEQLKEQQANDKASKKKSKKQLAAEEVAALRDEIKNKNLRSVYLSLAKILHPDSETDPELKLEKEEIMKQVTKAYEDKDIITLLVIETQWLKNTEERLANIKEDVAAIYIQLLKEQAKKLRHEKSELRRHPRFQYVADYLGDKVDRAMLKMSITQESYEREMRNIQKEISIITTSPRPEIKKFIKKIAKRYEVNPMDDFIHFFNSNRF